MILLEDPHPPSLLLINARSLAPKMDELNVITSSFNPSIIIITESWLHEDITDDEIALRNYCVPFRNDRQGKRGGGICVYLSKNYHATCPLRSVNDSSVCESLWLQIVQLNILLLAVYIPPNLPKRILKDIECDIMQEAEMFLEKFKKHRLIIAGDFNQFSTTHLEDSLSLKQLVCEATRGKSILDKVLMDTEMAESFQKAVVGPSLGKSDHYSVFVNPIQTSSNDVEYRILRDYRESNLNICKQYLSTFPWQHLYRSSMSIDEKCNSFHDVLNSAFNLIPHEKVPMSKNDKPWITPLLKCLINKRYAAFRAQNFPLYEHFKKKVKDEIVKAKQNWMKKADKSSKNLWSIVNNIRNKNHDHLHGLIKSYDSTQSAANEINKALSCHFLDKAESFIPADDQNETQKWDPIVNVNIVLNHLKKLKANKSPGSDNLTPRFLSHVAEVIAGPLTHIICLSIEECRVPKRWKVANICPIPKKPRPSIDDLRPISMLPIFSKILEKIILSSVKTNLLDMYGSQQFGFRPSSSTLHAHICLHDFVTAQLDVQSTQSVLLVSTDLKRAFDSLCHNKLLNSLERGQLPRRFLLWCKNFLQDRYQRVLLKHSVVSDEILVSSGVPQGSVLAPYLFAAHMGSLMPLHTNSKVFKYADDVITVLPISKSIFPSSLLHDELKHIEAWCENNGLTLNPDKTKVLQISKKDQEISPLESDFEGLLCDELKILGVIYNSKLSWTSHISFIAKKAKRQLYILRKLKPHMKKATLITIYSSVILSALEYCCPLYIGLDSGNARKIEAIRKQCHRIICGKDCDCNQFEELSQRRQRQALLFFGKMLAPNNPLHHLYPRTLPSSGHLALPFCRTDRRLSSFIPQCTILHNTSH